MHAPSTSCSFIICQPGLMKRSDPKRFHVPLAGQEGIDRENLGWIQV